MPMRLTQKQRDSHQQALSKQPQLTLLIAVQNDLEAVTKVLDTIYISGSYLTMEKHAQLEALLQQASSRLSLFIGSAESAT
jgi:hypothetical protein